jgi:uncharacterized membrane protein
VTGAWALVLWRHRDDRMPAHIARGIAATDVWFTALGGAMLTISGIQLIRIANLPWRELPWLRHGIELLAIATLVWLVVLIPDQVRMIRLADRDPAAFRRIFRRWSVIGWIDTLLLLGALSLMVLRPGPG